LAVPANDGHGPQVPFQAPLVPIQTDGDTDGKGDAVLDHRFIIAARGRP
jgi:hypothetical protein